MTPTTTLTLAAFPSRFASKVEVDESGCWIWQASTRSGYGVYTHPNGRRVKAHRYAVEWVTGTPVPSNLDVDHLCRVRGCCNPRHLEVVTHRINVLRGVGITAQAARADRCPADHPYSPENTYVTPQGHRKCRTCQQVNKRRRLAMQDREARRTRERVYEAAYRARRKAQVAS